MDVSNEKTKKKKQVLYSSNEWFYNDHYKYQFCFEIYKIKEIFDEI